MEGEGEPIKEISIEIFDEIKKAYDLSNDDVTILKEYSSLDKNHRERLKNYIKALIYVEKKEEG